MFAVRTFSIIFIYFSLSHFGINNLFRLWFHQSVQYPIIISPNETEKNRAEKKKKRTRNKSNEQNFTSCVYVQRSRT